MWAAGSADVAMERTGASEYMAMLTAAGTYTIRATLDGHMLPGSPLLKPYEPAKSMLSLHSLCCGELSSLGHQASSNTVP